MQTFDVVTVPFPYVEKPILKKRPALIVSNPNLAQTTGLAWVCMITSERNQGWEGDFSISDLTLAGLSHPSIVRTAKLATVELSALRRIGQLTENDKSRVGSYLKTLQGW